MTAVFIGGAPVALNGTTWVAVVAAPASGKQRQILSVAPRNKDIVQHTYASRKVKAGTPYDYFSVTVDPGKIGQLISNCVVLSATDESFEVNYEAAASSTESEADIAVFEVP